MPIQLIRDYPYRQWRTRFARAIRATLGSLLVLIGLAASVVLLPTGFVTLSDIIERVQDEPEELIPPGFPVAEFEVAFAAALIVAFVGLRYGRRLVRGRRSMVLFLRRFGFRGSMQAVTFAVVGTVGKTWRLVTLDDAEMAPVGIGGGTKLAFGLGERLVRGAGTAGRGVMAAFPWIAWTMWTIVGLQVAQVMLFGDWRVALRDGTVDAYARAFSSVMEGRIPVESFALSLPGLFAISITALAFALGGLIVVMAVLILLFPFFGIVILATSSAEAVRKAEAAKSQAIQDATQIRGAVADVVAQGRQTFAPRLVVLRVADQAWRQTVTALAEVTSASIVDISEPTEHLAWELWELERTCPGRWIAIGEASHVARWADTPEVPYDPASLDARFAARLGSRQVLAYTTDRKGMRRFARALHGMLLDLQDG